MNQMLEPAMLAGLGLVALWAHLRFPRLRPSSLVRAFVQVVISFGAFAILPPTLSFLMPLASSPTEARCMALALLIPILTYVLLTWVWLLARILQDLIGGPQGGHPAATEH